VDLNGVVNLFFVDLTDVTMALSIILILIMIFLERSEPNTIILWTVIFIFLPIIGFIIYLFFGQTFYKKHQFAVKNVNDAEMEGLRSKALAEIKAKCDFTVQEREFADAVMNAGGSVYSKNNDVKLYTEGNSFFKDLYEDLRNAKTYINMEFYIIRNDELSHELLDILIEKRKEGVEVRLMSDAIGYNKGCKRKILELRKLGGNFALFHRTVTVLLSPRKNNRNHRKIAVIDGRVGYVAGFNVGDEYLGKGEMGYWRDSGVRIEGHSVIPLDLRFLMDWGYATGKRREVSEKDIPEDVWDYRGNDVVQIVSGGPDTKKNPILMQYLKMISSAKKTLYIHTPYLVPDKSTVNALELAALSGVDVRIIMPDKPDHPFVFWTSLWNAGELMKQGVRVYQYNRGFVHSKTLVADGRYCSVGSANLDLRSMILNFETNAMICSERIGEEMDDAFMDDLQYCTEYSLEEHAKMTHWQKFKMSISRLFSALA